MINDRSRGNRDEPLGDEPGASAASVIRNRAVLSTSEAAAALGLSRAAVRRAIASGELAAARRGAAWRISPDDVVRFARRRSLPLPLVPRQRSGRSRSRGRAQSTG